MGMLSKVVRWLLALVLGFISWRALSLGDIVPGLLMLAGALVIVPPVGALVARLAPVVARDGVAIAVGFALAIAGLAVAGLDDDLAPADRDGATPTGESADLHGPLRVEDPREARPRRAS